MVPENLADSFEGVIGEYNEFITGKLLQLSTLNYKILNNIIYKCSVYYMYIITDAALRVVLFCN